jgi:hypothetical protein
MTGRRLVVGRHLRLISETPDGLHLEGLTRLQPGQTVELVSLTAPNGESIVRSAFVLSWSVAALGKEGPTYRGHCRWQ